MKMNVKDTWYRGIILVLILSLGMQPLFTADKLKPEERQRILEKSLIFPGLGQLKARKTLKGLAFILAEMTCITFAVTNNSSGNNSYELYQKASTPEEVKQHRQDTEKYDSRRNLAILAGVTVWILNLIDIYIFVKKQKKKNISLQLKNDQKGSISLNFTVSF